MLVEEIQSFFFPIFNSVVIFAMNEGDRMDNSSDNTRNKNHNCPEKELFLQHMKMLSRSLGVLCDCFLARANDCDEDPLWKKFYRIQMSIYLIAKKNLEISEPEGDMVHDLIRDSWLDVKNYMQNSKFGPISNVEQWFKTIRIDFPLDIFDPCCTFFPQQVFVMCQKDTEKEKKDEAVPF